MKNLKKIPILMVIVSLLVTVAFGAPVSYEEAKNVALNWMSSVDKNQTFTIKQSSLMEPISSPKLYNKKSDKKPYYIINLKPKGWVIVSGDSVATPVLGYSLESNMDMNNLSATFVGWMKGYEKEIDIGKKSRQKNENYKDEWDELSVNPQTFKKSLRYSIQSSDINRKGPLMGSMSWNQTSPYNIMTPLILDVGARTVVGCEATALSQIIIYHQWPKRGVGSYSYNHERYGQLYANFDTVYNWKNMINIDYAKVAYHVGVASRMDYGSHGSAGNVIPGLLSQHFKYILDKEVKKRDYTDSQWDALIKNSIDNGMPVYYVGSNLAMPHAWVIDGYEYSGNIKRYHFNPGWGGVYTGWYVLDDGLPSGTIGGNFNRFYSAIFGMHPDSDARRAATPKSLTITNISENNITVSWIDNSYNNHNGQGYSIYLNNEPLATVNQDVKSYTIGNLIPNTTYTIKIEAYNDVGTSDPISKTFEKRRDNNSHNRFTYPEHNAVFHAGENLTLRWKRKDDINQQTLFIRSRDINNHYKRVYEDDIYGESKIIKIPENAIEVDIFLGTSNSYGGIDSDAMITLSVINPLPIGFRVTDVTKNSATLRWKGNMRNASEYRIYNENNMLVTTLDVNTTQYDLEGLSENTEYTYSIKAYYEESGESLGVSKTFKTIDGDKSKSILTLPNDLKIKAGEKIIVTWETHGADEESLNVSLRYKNGNIRRIYGERDGGFVTGYGEVEVEIPNDLEGVFYLSVTLWSTVGESREMDDYTTFKIMPNNPSNLSVINPQQTTATLTWQDNADNETGYKIYQDTSTTPIATLDANTTSYSLTGLTAGTSYTYSVRAYNDAGESNATSITFETLEEETVVTKSIINSPANGSTVRAEENLTVEWESHGASREYLKVYYFSQGYHRIYAGYVTGNSKTVPPIPADAVGKRIYIRLTSRNNNHYLGTSRRSIRVEEGN